MPTKKKKKSVSDESTSKKTTEFQFPAQAIPDNIPLPPPPGQAVSFINVWHKNQLVDQTTLLEHYM